MNGVVIAKLATNIIASASVWKVVNDVIRNNVTVVSTADTVKIWTGSLVIGSMIADQASKHVNGHFDQAVSWIEARRTENAEKSDEKPAE